MIKIFSTGVFYKVLLVVLFFSVFSFSQKVFSQTEESYFLDDIGTTAFPQLYVNDISLGKPALTGEELTGTFYLHNVGQQTASNVSHQASIITLEEKNEFFYPIDIIYTGSFSQKYTVPQGKHAKNFNIKIPNAIPGGYKMGLFIETFVDDQPDAYEFIPIDIKSGSANTNNTTDDTVKTVEFITFYGDLNINDEKFFPLEGPTLQKGENINLSVEVSKSASYSEVVPNLAVYAGTKVEGDPVVVLRPKTLTLNSKTSVKDIYNLPVDLDPAVYTARLYYTDKEGSAVSSVLDARYIIPGLKPKIGTITYNNLDQNIIDSFDVTVYYSDIPLSARMDKDGKFIDPRAADVFVKDGEEEFIGVENNLINGISLNVTLMDTATGMEIDSKTIDDFAVSLSNPVTFNFKPISKAESVAVVVSMDKDGEFADQKESFIQVMPKTSKGIFGLFFENKLVMYGGIAALALLLIGIVLKLLKSNKKNIKTDSLLAAILIVCASLMMSALIIINPSQTQAGQVYLGSATVTSPKPPSVESYEGGSRMSFSARYSFTYCANVMPAAKGAISQPVLVGQPHTAFGPERNSSVTLGRATGSEDAQYRYSFGSIYSQEFTAPTTPGTYKFRYKVGIRNAQHTDRFITGEAMFLVTAPDVCTNIDGFQENPPEGYFQGSDSRGRSVCMDGDMICSVSKNPASVGDGVNFTARTRSNLEGNFTWFSGSGTSDTSKIIQEDDDVRSSTISRTYTDAGVHQVSALFTSEDGDTNSCTVGVTVYDDLAQDANDGTVVFLNPNAPAGVINLDLDKTITNTTCKATWTATHVVGCQIFNNNEPVEDVGVTGSKDVEPGSYEVRCLQVKNGAVAKSATRVCRENPELREI